MRAVRRPVGRDEYDADTRVDLSYLSAARIRAVTLPFLFVAALYWLSPVTLSVYPPFGMAPASFRALVMVPRDKGNRKICYGFDGPEYKQSCVQLDGDQARRVYTAYWNIRTAGEYEASAVVTRIENGKEKTYTDTRPFRVLGMGEPPTF